MAGVYRAPSTWGWVLRACDDGELTGLIDGVNSIQEREGPSPQLGGLSEAGGWW